MVKFLFCKHFWLRTLVLGLGTLLVVVALMQFLLLWLFNANDITQEINKSLAPTHRSIQFDSRISRHWFPKPGFTLRNVKISEPNDANKKAMRMGAMHYDFAWLSFFESQPRLDGIRLDDAHATLLKHNDKWNVADIIALFQGKSQSKIETFQLNNANILLFNSNDNLSLQFEKLDATFDHLDDQSPVFTLGGMAKLGALPSSQFQSTGALQKAGKNWQVNNWQSVLSADLPDIGPSTLQLSSNAVIDISASTGSLNSIALSVNSDTPERLALTMTADSAAWQDHAFKMPSIQGNAVVQDNTNKISSTVGFTDLTWQNDGLQINEIKSQSTITTANTTTIVNNKSTLNLALNGQYQWVMTALETRQTVTDGPTRFVSNGQGQSNGTIGGAWQATWQGSFDDTPVQFTADYQNQNSKQLTVQATMGKWDITPYLPKTDNSTDNLNRVNLVLNKDNLQLLNRLDDLNINGHIQIDDFKALNWQFQQFATDFTANRTGFTWQNLQANLYGGKMFGSLKTENTLPPKFTIEQTFQDINIQQWLQTFGHYANLEGKGTAYLKGEATGNDWAALRSSLNGEMKLNVQKGKLLGIDFNQLLQNAKDNKQKTLQIKKFNADRSTAFTTFQSQMKLQDGMAKNHLFQLLSDNLNVTGKGQAQLLDGKIDYRLLLADKPNQRLNLPMRINGDLANPTVTLDYTALTNGLYNAEQKQNAVRNALYQQWQLIQSLPAIKPE